tara:strand:+ start:141 stop:1565 length:1425 start_codon:yes stop_codon:yes gene_type:complete
MSKIEVNEIVKASGSTLTLGGSGTAVTLGTGATQSGFGRTGTVDWQTGDIKTSTFTAENGKGYFCNTTSGGFTVNLPAGSAGSIVSVQDYNNTFDNNNLIVDANGSEKINGGDAGAPVTLSTEGLGITFVYIDGTIGWRSVQSNEYATSGITAAYISASVSGSGNTLTTVDTNFKVAKFTGPGTFTVSCAGNSAGSNTVSYMVVAGGGGGGTTNLPNGNYASGGGGGAGGFREGKSTFCTHTASPLATTGLPVSATGYPITIGAGGAGAPANQNIGVQGSSTIFSSITSAGGGGGASQGSPGAGSGGSGGGGSYGSSAATAGSGNTPPVAPPQGNNGGAGGVPGCYGSLGANSGGGGGATAVGVNSIICKGGNGGAGATTNIGPAPETFAGGGGGGAYKCSGSHGSNGSGTGGTGGGGPGGPAGGSTATGPGQNGTANTGGGAGGGTTGNNGGSGPSAGGTGGSGIVYIRYKFQ